MPALKWDLFCRVIDNLGDAGVCWRLAAELAARGEAVRLVIDDPVPLALIAPHGVRGVEVLPWPGPAVPGDVVIEAFGCDPPPAFVDAMAAMHPQPIWLNLEYLSAEDHVERSHGLPSPQPSGLVKWFYYPGFTPRTGGLLRESGLMQARRAFDRRVWLAQKGLTQKPGERVVTLFCYDNPAIASLVAELAGAPTLLLLTPGPAQQQVVHAPPGLRLHALPWLSQTEFDHLLWACDLNFIRGEDSLVRALWAGQPFVWQLYPQHDGAHAAKLEAMLQWLAAPPELAALWRAWNGLQPGAWPGLPPVARWRAQAEGWRQALLEQADLASQLQAFVRGKRGPRC